MTRALLSSDQTRAICPEPAFGIAAYVGEVVDGSFEGRHVGVLGSLDDAQRWLEGDDSVKIMRIYGNPADVLHDEIADA